MVGMLGIKIMNVDDNLTTQRIEAFTDAVFAIAITLLVLEIRLPEHGTTSTANLAKDLVKLIPSFFAYILSFAMIGSYWVNHHYIFRFYRQTNHTFSLLNVLFLMCIAFLPFPTAVLGSHLSDVDRQQTAVAFYAFGLLLPSAAWLVIWLYASYRGRLIDPKLDPSFTRYLTRQYIVSCVMHLIALITSFFQPVFGLILATGLTLIYLLPSKSPVYRVYPPPSP